MNAATFASGPLAPGSLATILGSQFSGSNLTVDFDSTPAQILFSNDTQINLLVPASLGSKTSAQLIVEAGGISSTPQTVALAPFAPGIFTPGVLNQDFSVNGTAHPAAPASIIQIFATGLSGTGVITAQTRRPARQPTVLWRRGARSHRRPTSGLDPAANHSREFHRGCGLRRSDRRQRDLQPGGSGRGVATLNRRA